MDYKENINEITYLSFEDIINFSFIELIDKCFERIDTGECLGNIWSKYSSSSKIDAIVSGGIIEFVSTDGGFINKIYGKEINKNEKIFKATPHFKIKRI
jgi:hypothetical protein